MQSEVLLVLILVVGQEIKGVKFSDYFDYKEFWVKVLLYCVLVMLCVSNEGIVIFDIVLNFEIGEGCVEQMIEVYIGIEGIIVVDMWLCKVVGWMWCVKLSMLMMFDFMSDLWGCVQKEVIDVFV